MKKISSLEFKLNEILDGYRLDKPSLNDGCEPINKHEQEQIANENLRRQLSTFRNATTGENIFLVLVIVMSDLDKICKTFREVGIKFAVRRRFNYQYLFIGDRRDIRYMNLDSGQFDTFEEGSVDDIVAMHKCFEFEDEKLIAYSNS